MLTLYPFLSVLSISCIYIFFSLATRHPVNFSIFPANSLAPPPASMACLPPRHPHIPTSCLQPQCFQHDIANLSWNMMQQWAEKTWPKLSLKKLPHDSDVWSDWICEPYYLTPPTSAAKIPNRLQDSWIQSKTWSSLVSTKLKFQYKRKLWVCKKMQGRLKFTF